MCGVARDPRGSEGAAGAEAARTISQASLARREIWGKAG